MKLSKLVNELMTFLLTNGDREVVTAQKDPETANYTYGTIIDLVDYGEGRMGIVGNREEKNDGDHGGP